MANEQPVGLRERGPTDRLSDVLEIFSRFETNSSSRRDADFLAGSWIAADAALTRLHLEDAETPKLNALAALHRRAADKEEDVDDQ